MLSLDRIFWFITTILTFAIITMACRNDKPKADAGNTPGDTSSETFEDFYQRFHSDADFQLERITFPLQGMPALADSLQIEEGFAWTRDDWKILHAVDWDTLAGFHREIEKTDIFVNEIICMDDKPNVCMVRRFAPISGGWHLIYYSDMNDIGRKPE